VFVRSRPTPAGPKSQIELTGEEEVGKLSPDPLPCLTIIIIIITRHTNQRSLLSPHQLSLEPS